MSRPTINDVALLAGVSKGTVSRVLNCHPKVSRAAREAVQKAHQALADVARSVRDAIREQKAQSREIAEVRAGLAKLQTIRV